MPAFNDNTAEQVQDDPRRHDYNLDEWVSTFITAATNLQANTRTSHQMWPCGSDFNYQNAVCWDDNASTPSTATGICDRKATQCRALILACLKTTKQIGPLVSQS